MKLFMKEFNNFKEGIIELAQVSFSAEQALKWQTNSLPLTEEDAVKTLALNVALDRPTGNGVDWGECKIEITAYGVEYRTRGGITFGWQTILGANDFDTFDGEFVFFVVHPNANENSAAPVDSTLRESAEKYGWKESSDFTLALTCGG